MFKKIMISGLIGLFVLALLPQLAQAQFGKMIPIYDKINWKIYEGPHFEIYYYFPNRGDWAKEKEYLQDMIRWTEVAYKTISEELAYDIPISGKKGIGKSRIFFFWSRFNFAHHPLGGYNSGIAYSEPLQMRMVCVSKEYPDEKIQQIVTHEICHLFQFSLWNLAKRSPSQLYSMWSKLLTFLFEGWSQHISGLHRTEPNARLFIRYWVLNGGLRYVNLKDWTLPGISSAYEICYILAGYFYDYVKETYGLDAFRNFVKEFRRAKPTAAGFEKAVTQVLKTDFVELDRGFRKYLENQYEYFPIEKKEAFEYGRDILVQRKLMKPERKADNAYEPVVSPSGELVAAFIVKSDNVRVALIDPQDGTIIKELTGGYSLYKYGLWPIVDLDGSGRNLSFSPDNNHVLYFVQTPGRNPNLILVSFAYKKAKKEIKSYGLEKPREPWDQDETGKSIAPTEKAEKSEPISKTVKTEIIVTKKKVKKIEIELDDPESPEMSKDGKTVIFSAIQNGQRDIFCLNLETKEIQNLTNDKQFDYAPTFAPDGQIIVYVADVREYKKLFSLDLKTLEKKQLTFGLSNEIRPIYSSDGKTIFFISDSDKDRTKNIYILDIDSQKVSQLTDVLNGIRTVTPLKDNGLIFGAVDYRDSRHLFGDNLYEMTLNDVKPVATSDNLVVKNQNTKEPDKPQVDIPDIDPAKIRKYSSKFYLAQATFYGGADTVYGIYGFGSAYVTDLTSTKHILASIMQVGKYYKYNTFTYFDTSRRLEWGAVLSFEDHYFYPWFVSWGYNPYGEPALDAVLYELRFKRTKLDAIVQYPLDLCHRLEFSVSGTSVKYQHSDWQLYADYYAELIKTTPLPDDPIWQLCPEGYREEYLRWLAGEKEKPELRAEFLKRYINDGKFLTFNLAFVRDTALYKEFGPFTNDMYRLDLSWSSGGHNAMVFGEARKYLPLGSGSAFALRGYAGAQFGKTINPWIIGDLGELRGYQWMQFMGNRIWMANIELRFPFTKNFNLLGIYFGDIRAALFMDLAKIWFDDKRFDVFNSDDINPGLVKGSIGLDLTLGTIPIFGMPLHVAFSKRMTEVKFLPKLEKKWQVKLYFGYSF